MAAMFSVTYSVVYGWSVFTVVLLWLQFDTHSLRLEQGTQLGRVPFELHFLFSTHGQRPVVNSIRRNNLRGHGHTTGSWSWIGWGLVGYIIQATMPRNEGVPRMLGCFALFIPVMMIGEFISPVEFPTYENVSKIEIAAPPNIVWKYLIDFRD